MAANGRLARGDLAAKARVLLINLMSAFDPKRTYAGITLATVRSFTRVIKNRITPSLKTLLR